jgi:crotonobetainyl-CoA:carnitine CoA-transferase CaiB-like acyl-CoA transferase
MQPLQGVRIVEITTNASGPFATGILADQGADVIRLETIGLGDPSRHVGGVRGGVTGYNSSMNRNKRSLAVDLKSERLRPVLYELIRTADVFVQNSRPGALDRCGYGYGDLHRVNPELIYVSISGFGPDGPAAHQRVYDPVIQVTSGFAAVQGHGGRPELVKTIASDKIAALTAAQAISSALFARAMGRIGGHHVELSMLDASLQFLWPDAFWNHGFVGDDFQRKPLLAEFYRVLKTADGYVTAIVVGDEEFKGACRALELPRLLDEPRFASIYERFSNYGELLEVFEERAARLTSAEVVERMDREGVPCGRVNTLDEVITDPRVRHSGALIEYDHPRGGRQRQARPAAIFAGEPCPVRRPAPGLGEHTEEVLKAVGCSDAEIAALRAAGAIG